MNYRLIEHEQNPYVEVLAGDGRIAQESDALELLGALGEHRTNRLLIHHGALADDFYQLRTGLAGAVLGKLSTYMVKTALVLTPEQAGQGRFREMVLEANRWNRSFHVFYERAKAEEWLVA